MTIRQALTFFFFFRCIIMIQYNKQYYPRKYSLLELYFLCSESYCNKNAAFYVVRDVITVFVSLLGSRQ